MKYKEFNAIWKDKRLTPNLWHILVVLISFQNAKTGKCYPSLKTIAGRSGNAISTVQIAIAELQRLGWITVYKRTSKGGGIANDYLIHIPDK